MWKAYTMLAGLVIAIIVVTGYAIDTIESHPGKPKVDARVLAASIQSHYNQDMADKNVPSRTVKIVCHQAGDFYHCRALTLDPGGVKCIKLVVDAGPDEYEVKAASFDPSCPEGDKA